MLRELLAREAVLGTDVDLACKLNKDHVLNGALGHPGRRDATGHAAVRACMGSTEDHARVLQGLVSPADADVRIAQIYLHHRPITDVDELRATTAAIARMSGSEAQVRALDVLAQHSLSDGESLETLTQLFSRTRSWPVQNAIAGVLIRADPRSIAGSQLLRRLHEDRLKSSDGDTMVDALVHRLQLP